MVFDAGWAFVATFVLLEPQHVLILDLECSDSGVELVVVMGRVGMQVAIQRCRRVYLIDLFE